MALHWVVLETGSNQGYIHATSKQRVQVAASARIWELGYIWVRDAVREVTTSSPFDLPGPGDRFDPSRVYHVVEASGKAMLLAPKDVGVAIIEQVTARSLSSDSNIDVWGVVGDPLADDLSDAAESLTRAQGLLARHRHERRSPHGRNRTLPFHLPCAYTGSPAATVGPEPGDTDERGRSATVQSLWADSGDARTRLEQLDQTATLTARNLRKGEELAHDGWVAVLYADGNGIGQIFTNLARTYSGPEFIRRQCQLSSALEEVAWTALTKAVSQVASSHGTGCSNWLLPIVVGGDDFVLAVHGGYAHDLARELVGAFAEAAANAGVFSEVLAAVRNTTGKPDVPEQLSLAVGIVYVKPHHPFGHAAELADGLVGVVKNATPASRSVGGIDTLVLFESAVRNLDAVRGDATVTTDAVTLYRHGWPVAVPSPGTTDGDLPEALRGRSLSGLDELMSAIDFGLRAGAFTRGHLQKLRSALTEPGSVPVVAARLKAARDQIEHTGGSLATLEAGLPGDLTAPGEQWTPLLTALDLRDVQSGTAAHRGIDEEMSA